MHDHVLPFLGVSHEVFPDTICMVIPWMGNGSVLQHIIAERASGALVGDALVTAINTWVRLVQCSTYSGSLTNRD